MKIKVILIVYISILCLIVILLVLPKFVGGGGGGAGDRYTIDRSGDFIKDRSGPISREFKNDLESPKYSPYYPGISYYKNASAKNNRTDKYFSSNNSFFIARRGYPFVVIIDPEYRKHDPTLEMDIDMDGFPIFIYRRVSANAGKIDMKEMFDDASVMKFSDPKRYVNKYYGTTKLDSTDIFPVKRTPNYIIFNTSVDAPVGQYLLDGFPSKQGGTSTIEVNLICNPYHSGDDVYMEDQKLLGEYIDNDFGLNYQGTSENKALSAWHYDQFNGDNLAASMKLCQFLGNSKEFDARDPVSLMRHFTFGLNSEIILGLWPTGITIFRKPDGTPESMKDVPDDFNTPFTQCVNNDDCVKVFDGVKINNLRVDKPLCSNYTNAPSGSHYKFPQICGLEPQNPFRAPFIPKPKNSFYKECKSTSDCGSVDDWDGSGNMNDFPPLSANERKTFNSSCIKQSVCAVNAWNGGTPPGYWFGSSEILAVYKNTKDLARWAECWVYAGVMTTICRTLGMPCRQISAYEIARQFCKKLPDGEDQCVQGMGNFNATVNVEIDESGKATYADDIYMWSFHAWNNVWSKRKDLKGTKYSGPDWQVIDATPQELSFGVHQMGPVPLKAVKNMDMGTKFDSRFVNTEVNYTLVINGEEKQPSKATLFTNKVGLNFQDFKKYYYAPSDDVLQGLTMDDITYQYVKHVSPPGASMAASNSNSISVSIKAKKVSSSVGIYIDLGSRVSGLVSVVGSVEPILYTGKTIGASKEILNKNFSVRASQVGKYSAEIPASNLDLSNTSYFRFHFVATYPDKTRKFVSRTLYMLPDLTVREIGSRGNDRTVEVSFENPYVDTVMTGVRIELYSPTSYNENINVGDISPGRKVSYAREVALPSNSIFTAKLSSDNFSEPISGFIFV